MINPLRLRHSINLFPKSYMNLTLPPPIAMSYPSMGALNSIKPRALFTDHPEARGAFTPVSARTSFAQPPPPGLYTTSHSTHSNPTAPSPEKAKVVWPPTVRTYVQRAFAIENTAPEVDKKEMETKLKQVIASSVTDGTLHARDWSNEPLPQQIILQERKDSLVKSADHVYSNGVSPLTLQETNFKAHDSSSKKRKSSELDERQERLPPWSASTSNNVFEDRVSYPDKRHRGEEKTKGLSKSQKRKQRFENGHSQGLPQHISHVKEAPPPTPEVDRGPVVGRCQDLEKKYFRLTAPPNPDTVRPLQVLEQTLDHLKKKWKAEKNYGYMCDQLKSLRQDLTVQHIKTSFTVTVYEVHARIALEKGDLGEYNQCQTQLRALYSQHLGGHPEEFKAYRILYFIHTCNRTDMNDVLADLTATEKQHPAIRHALDARSALALGNFHRFFRLYLETPNMGAYLMDMFVGRERLVALSHICIS